MSFVCSEVVYRGTDYCSCKDMFHRVEAVGEGEGLKTWNVRTTVLFKAQTLNSPLGALGLREP